MRRVRIHAAAAEEVAEAAAWYEKERPVEGDPQKGRRLLFASNFYRRSPAGLHEPPYLCALSANSR